MTSLGVKHKDLHPTEATPASAKDYDNELAYPTIDVRGKLAEVMGAEDLKEGDCVIAPVKLRVKRHVKTTENGKSRYEMCLCVEEMGDMEECESEEADAAEYSDDVANLRAVLAVDE